jgi:hypothetical protein
MEQPVSSGKSSMTLLRALYLKLASLAVQGDKRAAGLLLKHYAEDLRRDAERAPTAAELARQAEENEERQRLSARLVQILELESARTKPNRPKKADDQK